MTKLIDHVRIGRRFQRSVRIDTDFGTEEALDGYVCPKSSAAVLAAMATHVAETGHAAFTWTGPYGSGKSSLALIVAALLGKDDSVRAKAVNSLDPAVVTAFLNAFPPKRKGWDVVAAVGRRAPLAIIIGEALERSGVAKAPPAGWTDSALVTFLTARLSSKFNDGLVIFVDEMGKILESSASGEADLYLFQQIGELASRSKGRIVFIGILHQAFGEYANRMSREVRDEWSKVQGRFVDLTVNSAGEEQIDLIARAIEADACPATYEKMALAVAQRIAGERTTMAAFLSASLSDCWPLHPVVAALLGPVSRRRFGQNQRSLFGFLNSAEPQGFQAFLRDADLDDLYLPERLWDYLQQNLEPAILASPDGHRWAVAAEAVARCEVLGGDAVALAVLKTIAIIDLFKERSGLIADEQLLGHCLPGTPKKRISDVLQQLSSWSLTLFKKYLSGYAIFAGSDFDLDAALGSALSSIDSIDFGRLNSLAGLQPILAKRHYHETGALRWFDIEIAPLSGIENRVADYTPGPDSIGLFLLAFPTDGERESVAEALARKVSSQSKVVDVLVGLSPRAVTIQTLAKELIALEDVRDTRPELLGDAVARREVNARMANLQSQLETELQRSFEGAKWYHRQKKPKVYGHFELSGLASDLAAKRYSQAPRIRNELLNRLRPSSNAVAAQNALLKRMVANEESPRLGIVGFPAEGGLYASVLEATGLHRSSDSGRNTFMAPAPDNDPANLLPLWQAADAHLGANESRSVSLAELYSVWGTAPFGLKAGLMPILAVSYILSRRNEVALYRQNIFQAQFTDLDIDYLVKEAGDIQLRWMNLNDVSRKLLSSLAQIVRDLDSENSLRNLEPIDVGRGLISLYVSLPTWAQRTMRLSANAIRIRDLFKRANDPNQFIFNDLPKLVGDQHNPTSIASLQLVEQRLRDGLQEMLQAYPAMLGRLLDNLLGELQVPNTSPHSLAELRGRAENIRDVSGDFRLNAFVNRLAAFDGHVAHIEGLASLATNKPPRDWNDADLDRAAVELTTFAQQFNKTETVARIKGRPDKRHAMAVMVGMGGRPTPLVSEFDVTDKELEQAEAIAAELAKVLGRNRKVRAEVQMAAIACLSAKLHSDTEGHGQTNEAEVASNG